MAYPLLTLYQHINRRFDDCERYDKTGNYFCCLSLNVNISGTNHNFHCRLRRDTCLGHSQDGDGCSLRDEAVKKDSDSVARPQSRLFLLPKIW